MLVKMLTDMKDFVHAQLCYQLFITPLPLKMEKEYRDFATRACEFIVNHRTSILSFNSPRHYVIHHFAQQNNPQAKKILITHGWTSRAAYMIRTIKMLHTQGYDVYALDFPAHGEAHGFQLTWLDAVIILRDTLNSLGPFYGVIGHSFGGSMLLNTLNLASQLPQWEINSVPERAVLLSAPTTMRTPVSKLARKLKLSRQGLLLFRAAIRQHSETNLTHLNFRNFINHGNTPILCIHGQDDDTINPNESIIFCRRYPHASLVLIPGIDHVGVLIDKRVENLVGNFLL